jgi:hypothetical protein
LETPKCRKCDVPTGTCHLGVRPVVVPTVMRSEGLGLALVCVGKTQTRSVDLEKKVLVRNQKSHFLAPESGILTGRSRSPREG